MSKRTRSKRRGKVGERPQNPLAKFPLTPHPGGQWRKKVRGKLHFFGRWNGDPKGEAALELWQVQKDDLLASRSPGRSAAS